MEITEICVADAEEFNINNADEQVCKNAYRLFLHNHRDHEGHGSRMATAKSIFKAMNIPPIVKT